jgi:DNA-binding CsgD family transcriptional regulator
MSLGKEDQNNKHNFLSKEILDDIYDELQEICCSSPELSLSRGFTLNKDGKQINLLALQIPKHLRHFHMPLKVCVIASECGENLVQKHNKLISDFNLTNSEIITLNMLAEGNNTNSIAKLLSLKPATIRQRLKQIYEKTAVKNQVELISLYNKL